jgi:hypothetical protein
VQRDRPLADRRGRHLGARLSRPRRARDDGHRLRRPRRHTFGALQASLDLAYGRSDVAFTFVGTDEMDEVRGSGSAELLEDGTMEIELDLDHGDDAILRAERPGSLAAC